MRYFLVILGFVLGLVESCSNKNSSSKNTPTQRQLQEPLINANKIYVKQESDEIDQYVRNHNYNVTTTGTGLRYMIYKKGEGKQAVTGKFAKVSYKISLLNGTECYSSDKKGTKDFLIDQDNVESGLHEGIKYLHVGDKAIFILPSHLAHGFIGDEDKIPPRSSVVYDIELLSLR